MKIVDGENEFEIVALRAPLQGEWCVNLRGDQVTQVGMDYPLTQARLILRPISGPAARPDRRKDHETRKWFYDVSWVHVALARAAYQRGLAFGQKEK